MEIPILELQMSLRIVECLLNGQPAATFWNYQNYSLQLTNSSCPIATPASVKKVVICSHAVDGDRK
jgi:hypothetical protein